ncbi:hypothetical protein EVAR_34828_1 [Eumeta japonica]|uniref:Uncharacterized protein n=1 Tax=Eumeta variegata TaxID=151549 RepID=A0A4C1WDY4_EUMVA|nr:hypothetical protein EVAR_34828_1 [Eumeta japonica]
MSSQRDSRFEIDAFIPRKEVQGCVRPLTFFYSDASADGVKERSLVLRSRSHDRLRQNATMSHAFSSISEGFNSTAYELHPHVIFFFIFFYHRPHFFGYPAHYPLRARPLVATVTSLSHGTRYIELLFRAYRPPADKITTKSDYRIYRFRIVSPC